MKECWRLFSDISVYSRNDDKFLPNDFRTVLVGGFKFDKLRKRQVEVLSIIAIEIVFGCTCKNFEVSRSFFFVHTGTFCGMVVVSLVVKPQIFVCLDTRDPDGTMAITGWRCLFSVLHSEYEAG
jgi:hypothetical protein